MNKQEKIEFVTALSDHIKNDVIAQIESGKVLTEWDGHELRCLLSNRHRESESMTKQAMKGKRRKIFNNHYQIANL